MSTRRRRTGDEEREEEGGGKGWELQGAAVKVLPFLRELGWSVIALFTFKPRGACCCFCSCLF